MKNTRLFTIILTGVLALSCIGLARAGGPEPVAPRISIGLGYYAILPNKLLLASQVSCEKPEALRCAWSKVSGPARCNSSGLRLPPPGLRSRCRANTFSKSWPAKEIFPRLLPIQSMSMTPRPVWQSDPAGMFPIRTSSMMTACFTLRHFDGEPGGRLWPGVGLEFEGFCELGNALTDWPVFGSSGATSGRRTFSSATGSIISLSRGQAATIPGSGRGPPFGPWRNLREDNTPIVSGAARLAVSSRPTTWIPIRLRTTTGRCTCIGVGPSPCCQVDPRPEEH